MVSAIGSFFRNTWQLIVVIPVCFFIYKHFSSQRDESFDHATQLRVLHEKEIRDINDAYLVERAKHEENVKKLNEEMALIQSDYQKLSKQLEEKKKQKTKAVIDKFTNDPEGLANEFSNITGFKVVK